MSFNLRVFRKTLANGEFDYSIRETYYNDNNEIVSFMIEPTYISSETFEGLKEYTRMVWSAFDKPVIVEEDVVFGKDNRFSNALDREDFEDYDA